MEIVLERENITIAKNAVVARGFIQRGVGLLGKKEMGEIDALIIPKCKSIHMWGMRFCIDVVFCDKTNIVVKTIENMQPWSHSGLVRQASYVVELSSGAICKHGIAPGDKLMWCLD